MLAVVSDLHLQDTDSYERPGAGDAADLRNVKARAFALFFRALGGIARRLAARDPGWDGEIRIAFAGDTFELNRSQQWFLSGPRARPYVDGPVGAGSDVDERVSRIYEGIRSSATNGAALELLRTMRDWTSRRGFEDAFPPGTRLYYDLVPGNHDRLLNLCPGVNRAVRRDLGLEPDGGFRPFPHVLLFPEYGVFVRHGHEYGRSDFEGDLARPDEAGYARTPFGDFMTTEFAARLLFDYDTLAREGKLPGVADGSPAFLRGRRLLCEFDDVRPQGCIFRWLRQPATGAGDATDLWPAFRRTVEETLAGLRASEEFGRWLRAHDRPGRPDLADAIQLLLRAPGGMLLVGAEALLPRLGGTEAIPDERILDDPLWDDPRYRYAALGHWHRAQNVPLRTRDGRLHVALCSGTWRHQHTRCVHDGSFATSRTMNYLLFFREEERKAIERRSGPLVAAADTIHMERYEEIGPATG